MAGQRGRPRLRVLAVLGAAVAGLVAATLGAGVLALLVTVPQDESCDEAAGAGGAVALGPPGSGMVLGASEYGGPGDPGSATVGARGDDLPTHPDSYAELGGPTWATARAMGGLAYMTPLRITYGATSAIAYKRDIGFGGPPVGGRARAIDLWWRLAARLGIPYESGRWSGAVRVERPPATGAGALLATGEDPAATVSCDAAAPLTPGDRAVLLPGGTAAAPLSAPPAVRALIAAGNGIAGRPYRYGAGHGSPLSEVLPAYDCSSSVEHLLYGAGLVPVDYTVASGALESFGEPGAGRWVTIYASPTHVFMYVAGLRWDTWNAGGAGDGSGGIGWHPLVRDAAGFVARHPAGL